MQLRILGTLAVIDGGQRLRLGGTHRAELRPDRLVRSRCYETTSAVSDTSPPDNGQSAIVWSVSSLGIE